MEVAMAKSRYWKAVLPWSISSYVWRQMSISVEPREGSFGSDAQEVVGEDTQFVSFWKTEIDKQLLEIMLKQYNEFL